MSQFDGRSVPQGGAVGAAHPIGLPEHLREIKRCLVFSVLNVTPDSFSDGGLFVHVAAAIKRAREQVLLGADVIDVGGESTRPGARRISAAEEMQRVLPVVSELAGWGIAVSIDTMRAEVADAAVQAGAVIINDVSGGMADPEMFGLLSSTSVPYVAMHWRGHSAAMDSQAIYGDVVADVVTELAQRLDALDRAGVDLRRVILDPGLGFAKTAEHNWALLARLDELAALGRPLLIGASRKRFLGALLGTPAAPRPVGDRDAATDAITALAAVGGAWGVRVHDVRGSADAVTVAGAWRAAGLARHAGGSS